MLIIDCELCSLRPWRESDLDSLVRHANDREVWLMLRDRFPHPYTDRSRTRVAGGGVGRGSADGARD